jgi:hypothetical protein
MAVVIKSASMPDFFVCYTLTMPTANFAMLLDTMGAVPVWDTGTSFAWLVRAEGTAQALHGQFQAALVKGVNFFVGEIVDGSCFVTGYRNPFAEFHARFPIGETSGKKADPGP